MNKLRSAIAALLLSFLLALALSACGKSASTTPAVSSTATSNVNMQVAAGNQQVTVSWDDPNNSSGLNATYNIYCSTKPFDATPKDDVGGKSPSVFLIASNTTSPFVHTGLTNGTTYYYFVTRVSGSTDGPPSLAAMAVPQAATPAAPTGMTISTTIQPSNNLGTVTLTIPNADPKLTYNVYWTTTANIGDFKTNGIPITNAFALSTGSNSSTTATFNHNNLAINTPYYYVVTAVGDSESAASQILTATPVLTKFTNYSANATGSAVVTHSQYGTPSSIVANIANQAVTITWGAPASNNMPTKFETDTLASRTLTTAASYAMTYNLYYWNSTGSRSATPQISNIVPNSGPGGTNTLTINNGLANGTSYSFCVTAVQTLYDATDKSILTKETQSAIISAMPQEKVLAVPSAIAASAGNQQVSLSWAKVSDPAGSAVKYNVYCCTPAQAALSWSEPPPPIHSCTAALRRAIHIPT